jgi:hypothetical protein
LPEGGENIAMITGHPVVTSPEGTISILVREDEVLVPGKSGV